MADAKAEVHIRYPYDGDPGDAAWLGTVAARHQGELAPRLLQSKPPQRTATFETISDAAAFVEELQKTGRWWASITT